MTRQDLNRNWLFKMTNSPYINPAPEWKTVDLPHDFSIGLDREPDLPGGRDTGFFPGGMAEYRKALFVPEEWKGNKVVLEFEGVYKNAVVRFNTQIVARQPYGYTTFHCDLTPYLMYGRENMISVSVNNSATQYSRWYTGSGIYRRVWLMTGESVHIKPWGVYATTPGVSSGSSKVSVGTEVENSSTSAVSVIVRSTLLDACGAAAASHETEILLPGESTVEAAQMLTVAPARLWSVEDPYLYTLKSEVIKDGTVIDGTETRIGIRSVSVDRNGLRLNGVEIKLKGGCVHHDCGLLGAAAYDRAEERKVELLKANGYNAVRCAHNPPSPCFLDACDRLGMLVIDEAFDCWNDSKLPNDYGLYFAEWWERDMTAMVLRDRNHPSIILWSTGNEIIERDGRSEGYAYARRLADHIRSLDDTRAVTNALCGHWDYPLYSPSGIDTAAIPDGCDYWGLATEKFADPLDVTGYNYLLDRYESDGKKYPGRIICGTETFPKEAYEYWEAVERLPYVIGDFVWTSLDYLGEAGIGEVLYDQETNFNVKYPWHQAFCGDIDICGIKRPQSYYRDCVWGISKAPYIAVYKPENYGKKPAISPWGWPDVISSWTWPGYEGKPTVVEVYSVDDEIELFLNGKTLGRKPVGKANRYTASFELSYEAGELLAVGYRAGIEVSRSELRTAGAPASIRLTADRSAVKAEFGDLSYVLVELLDAQGNLVPNATNEVFLTVSGAGCLLAVGSRNPVSEEPYTGNRRKFHEGWVMAVVRADGEKGEIVLAASADGIPASNLTIHAG